MTPFFTTNQRGFLCYALEPRCPIQSARCIGAEVRQRSTARGESCRTAMSRWVISKAPRFHQVSPTCHQSFMHNTEIKKHGKKHEKNTLECLQESFANLISFDISRYFKFPFVQAETVMLDTLSQLHPVTLIGGWSRSPSDSTVLFQTSPAGRAKHSSTWGFP